MNRCLDQSICCIAQAQATISQSFATLISTSIVPQITSLTDPNIKTCLASTLMTSNAYYVEANACLLNAIAYYDSVVYSPQMC